MNVPTNDWEAGRWASDVVPDDADDEFIVRVARSLLAILMRTWIDRVDWRWSLEWIREDLKDESLIYLELECSEEGMLLQRHRPSWAIWEAIRTLQHRSRWPDLVE